MEAAAKPFDQLSQTELFNLYGNFVVYRDKQCGGWADMSIQEFYRKHGVLAHKEAGKCDHRT